MGDSDSIDARNISCQKNPTSSECWFPLAYRRIPIGPVQRCLRMCNENPISTEYWRKPIRILNIIEPIPEGAYEYHGYYIVQEQLNNEQPVIKLVRTDQQLQEPNPRSTIKVLKGEANDFKWEKIDHTRSLPSTAIPLSKQKIPKVYLGKKKQGNHEELGIIAKESNSFVFYMHCKFASQTAQIDGTTEVLCTV